MHKLTKKVAFNVKIKLTGHAGAIYDVTDTSHDFFVSAGGDGYIVIWNKHNLINEGLLIAKSDSPVYSVFFEESNKLLYAGCMNGDILIIDALNKKIESKINTTHKAVFKIYVFKNKIYSLHSHGLLSVIDQYDKPLNSLQVQICNHALRCYTFINEQMMIGSSDGCLYQFDLITMTTNLIGKHHNQSIFSALYNKGMLYTGGRDARLRIENILKKEVHYIPAHMYTINTITSFDEFIVTGSRDKTLRIWDEEGVLIQSLNAIYGGHINSVNKVIKMDQHLISCSDDRSIIVWGM